MEPRISYWERIGKPKPPFWGQYDNISMARSLRLATIQSQYDAGRLNKDQARTLLSGALVSDDDTTIYDDSEYFRDFPLDNADEIGYNESDAE